MNFPSLTSRTSILLLAAFAGATSSTAQPAGSSPSAGSTPSAIMSPAIDGLRQALMTLRPEKWKASSQVTGESTADISSIERDLDTTLPPLLNTADGAPASSTQLLPAYRNVEALYDVVVRVTQTAVLAAPSQQSIALQNATATLQQSRRSFGDLLDAAANSGERQLHDTQARLRTMQATPPPPAPVCPTPPTTVKKPRPRAKPKTAMNKTSPPATH